MEQKLESLNQNLWQVLQKLIGLHRQLLDCVRLEKNALIEAKVKGIQECTFAKEALISGVQQAEAQRLALIAELALAYRKPRAELSLPNLVILVQGHDQPLAEKLRSAYNTLVILIERITEQNQENQKLVENSLTHIRQMKKNVLGESKPQANTYTSGGVTKAGGANEARLISKEV
ncbi:MAG: flagellar protein FlgN [Bacteriovoracia bacterium]